MQKKEDDILGLVWSCSGKMRRIWLKVPMFHLDPAKAGLKLNVSRGPSLFGQRKLSHISGDPQHHEVYHPITMDVFLLFISSLTTNSFDLDAWVFILLWAFGGLIVLPSQSIQCQPGSRERALIPKSAI